MQKDDDLFDFNSFFSWCLKHNISFEFCKSPQFDSIHVIFRKHELDRADVRTYTTGAATLEELANWLNYNSANILGQLHSPLYLNSFTKGKINAHAKR